MAYSIILIVVMIAIFYFMLIRPENKKKKAAEELRNSLKVGDEVTTIGGIIGTVCAVKDGSVVIETGADRVRVEMTKWAIGTKALRPLMVRNVRQQRKMPLKRKSKHLCV